MPLAGNNPGDRAMAHIRTAQRYSKQGKADDTQDRILRYVCGVYAHEGSIVQFNWTAPLNRPRPWTWTCGSTEPHDPEPEGSRYTVS